MSRLSMSLDLGLQAGTPVLSAGGATASGEVGGEEGSQYGFTDFSEFSVATGLPTGVTFYGNSADALSGSDLGIGNDGSEGNYFYEVAQNDFQARLWGFDFADSVGFQYGEILARMWWNFGGANSRWDGGPGFSIENPTSDDAGRYGITLQQYRRTAGSDHEIAVNRIDGTSAGSIITLVDEGIAETTGWFWVRFRITDNGGGSTNFKGKVWTGDISSEPGSWDLDGSTTLAVHNGGAMGIWQSATQQNLDQRCAYFAFSEDPDTTPPPTP